MNKICDTCRLRANCKDVKFADPSSRCSKHEPEKDYTITEYKNVTLVESKQQSNSDDFKKSINDWNNGFINDQIFYQECGFFMEKLQAEYESMKCCGNCGIEQSDSECNIDSIIENGVTAFICDNWEQKT